MNIPLKRLSAAAIIPSRRTSGSSGFDLHSLICARIAPGSIWLFDTGISLAIPEGYEGQVRSRSSLAQLGLSVAGGMVTDASTEEALVYGPNFYSDMAEVSRSDRNESDSTRLLWIFAALGVVLVVGIIVVVVVRLVRPQDE